MASVHQSGVNTVQWNFTQPITVTSSTVTGLQVTPNGSMFSSSGTASQTGTFSCQVIYGGAPVTYIAWAITSSPTGITFNPLVDRPTFGTTT